MSDPSASSSDAGFVPFRAATAIAGSRGEGAAEATGEGATVPSLPPPPPGVEPRAEGAPPAPVPDRPSSPPLPGLGATRADAVGTLVDWCVRAGLARGGLLARRDGTVLESRGGLPVDDAALLARRLCTALAAAREAGGREPVAAAIDLGAAWVTAFAVEGPGGAESVFALWGAAPVRGALRAALARWLEPALTVADS